MGHGSVGNRTHMTHMTDPDLFMTHWSIVIVSSEVNWSCSKAKGLTIHVKLCVGFLPKSSVNNFGLITQVYIRMDFVGTLSLVVVALCADRRIVNRKAYQNALSWGPGRAIDRVCVCVSRAK